MAGEHLLAPFGFTVCTRFSFEVLTSFLGAMILMFLFFVFFILYCVE
uniref:Uncharacterized protein n=1 Tax=Anguilla anguilla TaxID=7936 RepID=A0A0E9WDY8_ANGAN